jgi:hypothetical protein
MMFPTIDFAVFSLFPWAPNRYNTMRKVFLIPSSYIFYGFWSVGYLALARFSMLAFLLALLLGRHKRWIRIAPL